jgi:hypothetical protein
LFDKLTTFMGMITPSMSAALPNDRVMRPATRRGAARRVGRDRMAPVTRSALVADFLALCELDPAVEALQACGAPAGFLVGSEIVEHAADFEVVRDGVAALVDIVPESELAQHPLRSAFVEGAAALDGRAFSIETASTIRAEPRFTTVRLISACRRTPVSAGDRVRILHQLDECGTMRLVDCASAAFNASDGVAAVLALACEGLIAVDISRPILPETSVKRRKLPFPDPFGF